ncbi:hypothetical protein QEJ31_12565 [Pigmentibacter sp. JX0631]|uniref:hypothetical protein n=1 Tax=Pigmentibacter sp. JX0631 TaxID=2976982 RepID=UPI00246830D1|nr:hypothetical protein [Pigmentibacter sp. JX0631]WGL59356.1 hypothetical protein QEJ31_12565 [Pigmentibacter sp. JX0631]
MKKVIPIIAFSSLMVVSCIDHSTAPNNNAFTAASCPTAAVSVVKVSYNENLGKYTIFHGAGNDNKNLPNPLSVKNIQMAQIENAKGSSGESAKLNFNKTDGNCTPVLEMTQGYKIDLVAATNQNATTGEHSASSNSGGSSWAPFLMGALVGNAVSNAMQPRYAPPAYYLPPPASGSQGGLVTGGVSGKTPDELNKKYENQYKQSSTKKGFFSPRSTAQSDDSKPKKKGFFSGGSDSSSTSKKSGGFFKKKK